MKLPSNQMIIAKMISAACGYSFDLSCKIAKALSNQEAGSVAGAIRSGNSKEADRIIGLRAIC